MKALLWRIWARLVRRRPARSRVRILRRQPSAPLPPWQLGKADLELWLEARAAMERAAEDPLAYD